LLLRPGPVSEVVSLLIIRTAQPCRRLETSKAPHRVISLLDASVILLKPVVQVLVCPMFNFTSKYPAYGSRIGIMPVGRHFCWSMTNYFPRLGQELLGRLHIAVL